MWLWRLVLAHLRLQRQPQTIRALARDFEIRASLTVKLVLIVLR